MNPETISEFGTHRPNWFDIVNKSQDADWKISISSKTKVIDRDTEGLNQILMGTLQLGVAGIISSDEDNDFNKTLVTINFSAGSLALLRGTYLLTTTGEPKRKTVRTIIISDLLNGELYTKKFTNIEKLSKWTEKTMRKARGDRKSAFLKVKNDVPDKVDYNQISLELDMKDDVELAAYKIYVNGKKVTSKLIPQGNRLEYSIVESVPLQIGFNEVEIKVADWSAQLDEKKFQIFRTRGTGDNSKSPQIVNTEVPPLLTIRPGKYQDRNDSEYLDAGESGIVSFTIRNEGHGRAKNIRAVAVSSDPSSITVSKVRYPNELSPGDSGKVKVLLFASSGVKTQEQEITLRVEDLFTESTALPMKFTILSRGRYSDIDIEFPGARLRNHSAVAVVIGNGEYEHEVPNVKYATRDAQTVRDYLHNTLGYSSSNIIYKENATLSTLRSVFGSSDNYQGRLYDYVIPGKTDVFVYYSGHGAPDVEHGTSYLLPVNVSPDDITTNGYAMETLVNNLNRLPARSTTLIVDACFSGNTESGMIIKGASPVNIRLRESELALRKGTTLYASRGNQMASWFDREKHGLFTYYVIKGLRGAADKNRDKKITVSELKEYVETYVPSMARRTWGRNQNPVVLYSDKDDVMVDLR